MRKLCIFLLVGLYSSNTYALDPTQGPLQHDSSLCSYGYNPNCGQNSGHSEPSKKTIRHTIVNIPSKYGALAFSEKAGYIDGALNKDSKQEAIESAKALCRKGSKGAPCKIMVAVRNGCVAAAFGKLKGKFVVTAATEDPGKAENEALNRCHSTGAKDCKIYMPEGCSIP